MAVPTPAQNVQQALNNYTQALVLITQVIANPTQANVDAAVQQIDRLGVIQLKPTYSLDGENYDWAGYAEMCSRQIEKLQILAQRLAGPFAITTRLKP